MDAEYMAELARKSQIAQSAHKGASKAKWPMTGESGPCKVWPDLPSVRDRLKFITAGMTRAEIAAKLGIGVNSVGNSFSRSEKLRRSTLAEWAKAFECPLDWLAGDVKKKPEAMDENAFKERNKVNTFPAFRLQINGVYSPEQVVQMLPSGGGQVSLFCVRGGC